MPQYRAISIFNELVQGPPPQKQDTSGRSPKLISRRDSLLLHRFYFKSRIQRKLYPDTLQELEDELCISPVTISKIIQAKADQVLAIKAQKITVKELKEKFPWLVWN